jgi:8-oxo-dGTP pyrophosphatase MutT (NUDIX family)
MPTPVTPGSRHFTASAAVFDVHARRVLLVDHIATGLRQFPGGHVDPDEDGGECAMREVLEETGVTARLVRRHPVDVRYGQWLPGPLMVCEHPAPAKPSKGEPAHRHLDMLYVAEADSSSLTSPAPGEVRSVGWMSVDGIDPARVRADVPVVVVLAWYWLTGEDL